MAELGEYLEQYTFDYLLSTALDRVPNDIDKRQGSVIYDAIAPACYALADVFLQMRQIYKDTYIGSANAEYLDERVLERGIIRNSATKAIRKGIFKDAAGLPINITLGTRFSTLGEITYTYFIKSELTIGEYLLECEQAGTGGNAYVGDILPIGYIQPLTEAKLLDIVIPAEDAEHDEELRSRYFESINATSFAGNIAAYDELLKSINGVGEVQVYPVWNGGGTVKLSVVDSSFMPLNQTFINLLQEQIDPPPTGTGLGLAPIGHEVTVTTPTLSVITFSAKITLKSGASETAAQTEVENEIRSYIESIARDWGKPNAMNNYSANIYTAQITSAILRSPSVGNATNVKTNGNPQDVILAQNSTIQEIPIMGTVILTYD